MARNEHDREDLLAEAVHLVVRGRIESSPALISDKPEDKDLSRATTEWVIGWRKSGAGSLYVDGDPVYQFNVGYRLRRLFGDGERFACENGQLFRLIRQPDSSGRLRLSRQAVSNPETDHWQERWRRLVGQIRKTCREPQHAAFQTVGITEDEFQQRVLVWIDHIGEVYQLASGPEESLDC